MLSEDCLPLSTSLKYLNIYVRDLNCIKDLRIFLLDSLHHSAHNSKCSVVSDTLPIGLT